MIRDMAWPGWRLDMIEYTIKDGIRIPKKYEWVDLSSEAFREALETVMDRDVLTAAVTGPGGSGKSILYKMAYEMDPERTICAASTGIAAFNLAVDGVPAVTVHSALRLKPMPWHDPEKVSKPSVARLLKAKTLLIALDRPLNRLGDYHGEVLHFPLIILDLTDRVMALILSLFLYALYLPLTLK